MSDGYFKAGIILVVVGVSSAILGVILAITQPNQSGWLVLGGVIGMLIGGGICVILGEIFLAVFLIQFTESSPIEVNKTANLVTGWILIGTGGLFVVASILRMLGFEWLTFLIGGGAVAEGVIFLLKKPVLLKKPKVRPKSRYLPYK